MDQLPFSPFAWPRWLRAIIDEASSELWGALIVAIIAFILTR